MEREAAANERERKRLYVEGRKAEAAAMAADIADQIAELDAVLTDGISGSPLVSFATLRNEISVPNFDAGGLDQPVPAPRWEDFAPPTPGVAQRIFSGGKQRREEDRARQAYEQACTHHAAAEAAREHQLDQRRRAHHRHVETLRQQRRDEVDQFEHDVRAADQEAVGQFFTLVLDTSPYPEGFPHLTRTIYQPEPRQLIVDYELPPQEVVPTERDFRYVQTRDQIEPMPRADREVKDRYRRLIAQVALRTLHEIFAADPADLVDVVTFLGRVSTIDKATGQPIRPHLISVSASKETFSTLVLEDLDPVACLKHLNALVSNHPYDLEPVRPIVDFEALLSRYKFIDGMDALAGLDSRPDLLEMSPTEFEHFTRQLFEGMGMKSWTTQASNDDGVDAVATNEDPVFGGLCVIQAKRYRGAVGVDAVRELAGVMEDKHATKGILVTTSWVTNDGHAFATRHGRIQIMDGEHLVYLCKEHLGLDVLIGLPKPPPRRRRQ